MKIYFNEITSGYLTENEFNTMVEGLVNGVEDERPTPDDTDNIDLWRTIVPPIWENAKEFLLTFVHEIFDTTEINHFSAYNEGYSYRDQFIKEHYGEEK